MINQGASLATSHIVLSIGVVLLILVKCNLISHCTKLKPLSDTAVTCVVGVLNRKLLIAKRKLLIAGHLVLDVRFDTLVATVHLHLITQLLADFNDGDTVSSSYTIVSALVELVCTLRDAPAEDAAPFPADRLPFPDCKLPDRGRISREAGADE